MYSIACVDDDQNIIKEIKEIFNNYSSLNNELFTVDEFTNPLAFNTAKKYDCIFLDIEMKEMDGLSLAESIRKYDSDVLIVFITHLSNLAIEGYRVHAFDFIVKPIDHKTFNLKIDRIVNAINKNEQKNKQITLNTTEGIYNVGINNIILIESDKHYLNVYLNTNQVLRMYGKLIDFKERFNNSSFAFSGKSYLVNLNKVAKINSNEVILENKKIVPITRQYKEDFINAFTVFASGE